MDKIVSFDFDILKNAAYWYQKSKKTHLLLRAPHELAMQVLHATEPQNMYASLSHPSAISDISNDIIAMHTQELSKSIKNLSDPYNDYIIAAYSIEMQMILLAKSYYNAQIVDSL